MTKEEDFFKENFPEYVTEKGEYLTPYWDLFRAGVIHATFESKVKIEQLEKENAELKEKLAGAERTRDNLIQLGFPTFQSCKEYADKMNYSKTIIKDLLDNSDEYARQRAEDFLKESE